MAENEDILEIPNESEKWKFKENSVEYVESVLGICTLKNPEIFSRNIGGRKTWADISKKPKKAWDERKEKLKNETKTLKTFEEIAGDLKEYREKSQEWKNKAEKEAEEKPDMVGIFNAGFKTRWGGSEEERQTKIVNSSKIIKTRQVNPTKKPKFEQKKPSAMFYKLGQSTKLNQGMISKNLNRDQISAMLDDIDNNPIDMRVPGTSRAAKIQATRMINSEAQKQYSDDVEEELDDHFKAGVSTNYRIPKHTRMTRENTAGYTSKSRTVSPIRPISPVFEPEEKGECPMCGEMIGLQRLPTHAAYCEGTVMYVPE